MTTSPTKEPQYSLLLDVKEKHGIARLGLMVNESWNQDPKRTLFTLARYKFVARMLAGDRHVLEVIGGAAAYRHKFGLGYLAPWLAFSAGLTRC